MVSLPRYYWMEVKVKSPLVWVFDRLKNEMGEITEWGS